MMFKVENDIYIYDSSVENGVQLTNWKDFKQEKHYLGYSGIAYRKLKINDEKLGGAIKARLWDFVTMHVGKKYELNIKKLFRRSSFSQQDLIETDGCRMSVDLNTTLSDLCVTHEELLQTKNMRSLNILKIPSSGIYRDTNEGFFCSELVAAAFKSVGLLDATKSSARYLPVSFSQKKELHLLKGGSLSKEYELILLNPSFKN